jgi:peptide/nickel transport system substrate-binding protein
MWLSYCLTPVFLAMAGLGAAPAAGAGDLAIGISQFPPTLVPNVDPTVAQSYVLNMALRPMTAYDRDWRLVCLLCVELPTLANGMARHERQADGDGGMAVTYRLNPQARWGDGVPVSVEDVIFTWRLGLEPKSGLAAHDRFARIRAIDADDDKTFTVHLDRVAYDYNVLNDIFIVPAHIERAALRDPANYRRDSAYATDPTNPGLYFGPYRVIEVEPGSHVVLAVNPSWSGARPAFERIVVRAIENTAALEANLLSGTVDYVAGELGFTLDQAMSIERRHPERFDVVYRPSLVLEQIAVNLEHPALSDRRLRQALLYGIDRSAIADTLFAGHAVVAHGPVYDRTLPVYDFDQARAAALLDQAGWTLDAEGRRRDRAGESLALTLASTAGNRARELIEQALADQWRRLGIAVTIQNQPARVLFGETLPRRRFPGLALFAWVGEPGQVPRWGLASSAIPTEGNGFAGDNVSGYADARMDELLDLIETEPEVGRRATLWAELQRLYAHDLPALPLLFMADAYVFPKWLKGVEPTGHLQDSTTWIETWRRVD